MFDRYLMITVLFKQISVWESIENSSFPFSMLDGSIQSTITISPFRTTTFWKRNSRLNSAPTIGWTNFSISGPSIQEQKQLIFCASITHADHVGQFLRDSGISVAIIHSKPHSDPRLENIDALKNGEIECICTVDLFNEGVDIPSLDRVIMLRPTSSGVVFLQQLGRGLRRFPKKEKLTVIDLVGNHHVFLQRLHAISSIAKGGGLRTLLQKKSSILPRGCSIDMEVGLIELLSSLMGSHNSPMLTLFHDCCTLAGRRPENECLSSTGRQNKSTVSRLVVCFPPQTRTAVTKRNHHLQKIQRMAGDA